MTENTNETPDEELTARDKADLASLDAPETDTIYILNRMAAPLFDAAPDPVGIILAMADSAFKELVGNNGGRIDSVGVTVGRSVHEGEEVVEMVYSADRPKGWEPEEGE